MSATTEQRRLTAQTLRKLQQGAAPNGVAAADCGPYEATVQGAYDAYHLDGTEGVFRFVMQACKVEPSLIRLLQDDSETATPAQQSRRALAPPLSVEATEIYQYDAPCAQWLDRYVAFWTEAAPMTPPSFHEATGLFVVSMAIARRLKLRASTKDHYPNLFCVYIAPAGEYRRTTAYKGVSELVRKAGLEHLLLPATITPERMISKMSIQDVKIPKQPEKLLALLREKSFAAQRGWLVDEVSSLFSGMKREYNAGLLEMVLKAFDCEPLDKSTQSRGDEVVLDTYLSVYGSSNPELMGPFFANRSLWLNGLFSRFAILTPRPEEENGDAWQFFGDALDIPDDLIHGLQAIYNYFPIPVAEVRRDEASEEEWLWLSNNGDPISCAIDRRAWDAWDAYSKATSKTLLRQYTDDIDGALRPSYVRFGEQAIKVAMNLATIDAAMSNGLIRITPAHFARAQRIVEGWRESMHRLWQNQTVTEETRLMEHIQKTLKRHAAGLTARDLVNLTKASKKDIEAALELLDQAGQVQKVENNAKNGRVVCLWRRMV